MVYPFGRFFLGNFVRMYTRKIEGHENIPRDRPFIAVANHSSYLDDLAIPYLITRFAKKKFHIFVNSRYYSNVFFKLFLDHFGCIKVDVSKDVKDAEKRNKTNEKAIEDAVRFLARGDIFGIFPEGGRNNGTLIEGKTGVATVALKSKVPVLPIAIIGSHNVFPKGAKFPRFRRFDISIGKPMTFEKYYGSKDYNTLRKITDEIMGKISFLIAK